MTTAIIQKLKKEIKQELLEEFILPMMESSKDTEGDCRESFVKRILKASKSLDKGGGKKFADINLLRTYLKNI